MAKLSHSSAVVGAHRLLYSCVERHIVIHTIVESEIGDLLLLGDGQALTGLYTSEHVRKPQLVGDRDDQAFAAAREQLNEYFAGERRQFDLKLVPKGTDFQRTVWNELCLIPYGETASYGELAHRIGSPTAVRAVGLANGRNPLSIVIACHRVIGGRGALTGYAGGLAIKEWLLKHETSLA